MRESDLELNVLSGTVKQHHNNRPLRFKERGCLGVSERPLNHPTTTTSSNHPATTTDSHTLLHAHARREGKRRRRSRGATFTLMQI